MGCAEYQCNPNGINVIKVSPLSIFLFISESIGKQPNAQTTCIGGRRDLRLSVHILLELNHSLYFKVRMIFRT